MLLLGSALGEMSDAAFLRDACQVRSANGGSGGNATAPVDRWWAPRRIGMVEAWRQCSSRGAGERIALIAMKARAHDELEENALQVASHDETAAKDGTALATLAVSRPQGEMVGIAPAASVLACPQEQVPEEAYACGVWLLPNNWSSSVTSEAIERAIASGIIVIAPRSAEEVGQPLSIAATDASNSLVAANGTADFAAPGRLVWAGAKGGTGAAPASGDDVAAALVAGIAALFRAYHGRDKLAEVARKEGVSVQEIFRRSVCATARCPNRWDEARGGAGIVDAAALLRLPLSQS